MVLTLLASIAALSASGRVQSAVDGQHASEMDVCSVLRTPSLFSGKEVLLRARAEGGHHAIILIDEHSRDCAITLEHHPAGDDDPGVDAFMNAIFSLPIGTLDKTITAVFEGVIR